MNNDSANNVFQDVEGEQGKSIDLENVVHNQFVEHYHGSL